MSHLIEARWNLARKSLVHASASEATAIKVKHTFYSGAAALLDILVTDPSQTPEAAALLLGKLFKELEDYTVEVSPR